LQTGEWEKRKKIENEEEKISENNMKGEETKGRKRKNGV